jgi:lipoprotein-releasing system ATP-binding protein
VLIAENIEKSYATRGAPLAILRGVSLRVAPGEAVAIVGPSGSGKSTLLHILGTLDPPTAGTVRLDDEDPYALPERALARFRNRQIGFIFQDHHLLPQCTALENVLIPTLATGGRADGDVAARGRELLEQVGLAERAAHRPAELSGGERQRVALARALINHPRLVLADEPTGNLDRETAAHVGDLLATLPREHDVMLVVVTHDRQLATRFARRCVLDAGVLKPADADEVAP